MRDERRLDRRTVLGTIGALGAATIATQPVSAAGDDQIDCRTGSEPISEEAADGAANHPYRYLAVVDRIVDGAHVVILLEEDDRVVDQVVVDRGRLERVEERDRLLATVWGGQLLAACLVDD